MRYEGGKRAQHDAWLAERKHGIGGADTAAVMGVSPWQTTYELWAVKTGTVEPDSIDDRWPVQRGHALEGALRNRFRDAHKAQGWHVVDGTLRTLISRKHPFMLADLDGVITAPDHTTPGVLEIKTASRRSDWLNDDGTYHIPVYYLTQVTHYLAVTGWTWGYVYVAFSVGNPVEILFERDEQNLKSLVDTEKRFWHLVQTRTAPSPSGIGDIREMFGQDNGKTTTLNDDNAEETDRIAQALSDTDAKIKELTGEKKNYQNRLAIICGPYKTVKARLWQITLGTRHYKAVPAHMVPAKPARTVRGSITIKPIAKVEK